MFIDQARIYVKGGDGGNGIVSWRREKYVPMGGPAGGDAGRGGNVVLVVDEGLRTLLDFKYQRHFKAERGEYGGTSNKHGANGEDLVLRVPPGTVVRDADTGEQLADLTAVGQQAIIAKGGRGGRGNAHFLTNANRAPGFAEKGEPGQERWVSLELKVVADVGLVGFPNAGKSTFLSRVSAAQPKVASYPFTTLTPNLGVASAGEGRSFVLADIPGLIEGAHEGTGLGHEFLRHVERTRLLLHVLDTAATDGRDPLQDFETINRELILHDATLASRPQLVICNKLDLPEARERFGDLAAELEKRGYEVFGISGVTGEGIDRVIYRTAALLDEMGPAPRVSEMPVGPVYRPDDDNEVHIDVENGVFVVSGKGIERLAAMTEWRNEEAVRRFNRIFAHRGIEDQLRARGAKDGDTVRIRDVELEFGNAYSEDD
ncbi:MAG: GTPase ObgE [Symbiobacteriia bacterium]